MYSFTPQNAHGKIITLTTKEDFSKYFSEDDQGILNAGLGGNKRISDYLPFAIEFTQVDVFTVKQDLVYSGLPQIIQCNSLVFDGGSITSYVQLVVNAKTTTLRTPSPNKNYQILVSGSTGSRGTPGTPGQKGTDGTNGQSKSCKDAQDGDDGLDGGAAGIGGPGGDGTGTPVSSLVFGNILLGNTSLLTVLAQGGNGGEGGVGGTGGQGGIGGTGGNSTSTGCTCYTNGGNGGDGGDGFIGGQGGPAGNGSTVNQPMTITVASQPDLTSLSTNAIAGSPGLRGTGGPGGTGGTKGHRGTGTKHGHDGTDGSPGAEGIRGGYGTGGSNGSLPQISSRVASS